MIPKKRSDILRNIKLVFRCDYEVSTAESGYCYHGMCNPTLTKNIEEMMTEGE